MLNPENVSKVIEAIKAAKPASFHMDDHSKCVTGFAKKVMGLKPNDFTMDHEVQQFLGLTFAQFNELEYWSSLHIASEMLSTMPTREQALAHLQNMVTQKKYVTWADSLEAR